jgi:ParB-like chromosome segregation protein Spo0J
VSALEPHQVMPSLSDEEYAALKADIDERGVLVPVVVDQDGNILDGHHRQRIATELGIEYPTEVRQVGDEEEAREVAFMLNLARRHLTREQKRALIQAEIDHDPALSDRKIARRLRCSPSTVGAVRNGGVSNLDNRRAILDLGAAHERYVRDSSDARRRVGDLPDEERPWLTAAVARAEVVLQATEDWLNGEPIDQVRKRLADTDPETDRGRSGDVQS